MNDRASEQDGRDPLLTRLFAAHETALPSSEFQHALMAQLRRDERKRTTLQLLIAIGSVALLAFAMTRLSGVLTDVFRLFDNWVVEGELVMRSPIACGVVLALGCGLGPAFYLLAGRQR